MENVTQALKQFWAEEKLTDMNYMIIKNVGCSWDRTRPQGVEIAGYDTVFYNGGDLRGYLDRKSMEQTKGMKHGTKFRADILVLRPGGEAYANHRSRGFYYYNPHRTKPDSVLAFRITEILEK